MTPSIFYNPDDDADRDFLERWNRWDRARKADWLQRRRYLVHGLIRAAAAYRAARAALA